jgi:branched-chain amino acid transport system permease protein
MGSYLLDLLTLWAIFAIAATVVAALVEDAGFMHVGAAAFMGIGAYTAGLLSTRAGVDPQLALLATLPAGAVAGLVLHLAVGRLTGDILALATLAVGVILHGVMLNAESITSGPMGIAGIPKRSPLMFHEGIDALLFLTVVTVGIAAARRANFGIRVHALREDEGLASDLELSPKHIRATLWIATSAALSFSGGLFAFQLRYIDPSSFTVRESVSILAMALLFAGPRNLKASLGALVFIALPELLRFTGLPAAIGAEIRQLLFGITLLVVAARAAGPMRGAVATGGARA